MTSDFDKMKSGELYFPSNKDIVVEQTKCLEKLYDYNSTRPSQQQLREKMLKDMFAEIGEGCYIEPPFHANFGGAHVHFGKYVYANFNLTCVDDGDIFVGDYTLFGPNVTVATAGHPIEPNLRKLGYQYNIPITIGINCWIGANTVICPGVSIGDNVVIGAGSVVTKDIPSNVVAFGNPCKVIRQVGEKDRQFYFKNRKIDEELLDKIK